MTKVANSIPSGSRLNGSPPDNPIRPPAPRSTWSGLPRQISQPSTRRGDHGAPSFKPKAHHPQRSWRARSPACLRRRRGPIARRCAPAPDSRRRRRGTRLHSRCGTGAERARGRGHGSILFDLDQVGDVTFVDAPASLSESSVSNDEHRVAERSRRAYVRDCPQADRRARVRGGTDVETQSGLRPTATARGGMKVLLAHPEQDLQLDRALPLPHEALVQHLELEIVFQAMAAGRNSSSRWRNGSSSRASPIRPRSSTARSCCRIASSIRGTVKQIHDLGARGDHP